VVDAEQTIPRPVFDFVQDNSRCHCFKAERQVVKRPLEFPFGPDCPDCRCKQSRCVSGEHLGLEYVSPKKGGALTHACRLRLHLYRFVRGEGSVFYHCLVAATSNVQDAKEFVPRLKHSHSCNKERV
jgi:hypothetical protein